MWLARFQIGCYTKKGNGELAEISDASYMGKQGAQTVVDTLTSCQGFGQTHFVFLDWKGEQVLFSKLLLKKGGLIAR